MTQPPAPCFATIQETAFSRGARATAGAPAARQRGRLPAKAALCRRKGLAGRPCGHPMSGTRRPPPAHQALLPLGDVPGHVIPGSDLDWDPSGDGPAPPVPRPPPRAPEPVTFHRDRAAAARCRAEITWLLDAVAAIYQKESQAPVWCRLSAEGAAKRRSAGGGSDLGRTEGSRQRDARTLDRSQHLGNHLSPEVTSG